MSTTFDPVLHVPVRACLAVFAQLTPAQVLRLETLTRDWNAQTVSLGTDSAGITFALYNDEGDSMLNGLIEPCGRSHT